MRKTKLIISCLSALTLLGFTAPCIASANEQESVVASEVSAAVNSEEGIDPQSDIIQWVYQEYPDGSLYKRLYNYSKCFWIGDWIKIRDAYK